jgi:hypothetical protein
MSAKASRQAKLKQRNADLLGPAKSDAKNKHRGPQAPRQLKIHSGELASLLKATSGAKSLFGATELMPEELKKIHNSILELLKKVKTPRVGAELLVDGVMVKKEKPLFGGFAHKPGDEAMFFTIADYCSINCNWDGENWQLVVINQFTNTVLRKKYSTTKEMLEVVRSRI